VISDSNQIHLVSCGHCSFVFEEVLGILHNCSI
jgi:hypothetical protein